MNEPNKDWEIKAISKVNDKQISFNVGYLERKNKAKTPEKNRRPGLEQVL